ncbi:MAG TPA: FlgD immunoglobulin-like domain containing protein [Streptosporangiaceae bacterium]
MPGRLAADTTHAPLLGASVSAADIAQETSEFGHMGIVRVYYPGLPSSNAWTTGLAAANKSPVIVSFKALPTAILSGQDDAALSQFFDTAPTGNPIYWSYYHEPEGNIADGEFTLADYKAAWAHVAALARAAHNSDLHSTLILGGYDLSPSSHRSWRDYLPGGGIISTLGWDAYPPGSAKNENPVAAPPASFMAQEIAAAKSVGLPYGFAEFGLSTPAGRPAWLTEVGNYLLHSGAVFASLFNGNAQYPTLKLTDAASVAVWKGFVARFGSDVPVSSPTTPALTSAPSPGGTTAPAPGPVASGLEVNPATIQSRADSYTTITVSLGRASDVTVLILDHKGTVVRTLSKPARPEGTFAVRYWGFDGAGHRVPAGSYQVLVVASNANGSGTAESPLQIGAP